MGNKLVALLLSVIIVSGLMYPYPVFAHNFGVDENALWLAKIAEIKTEIGLVAKHVGNTDAISYYSNVLNVYWNANDTLKMGETNTTLQTEISSTIHATLSDAQAGNQVSVSADVSKLNAYLDESIPVIVDKNSIDNSTTRALAIVFVLQEASAKYGNALNSKIDLNDMSQMNMSEGGSMSDMSDNMSSMSSTVVDQNAFENSIGLATTAQNMFNDLATNNTDKSDTNTKISSAFAKLIQDLDDKSDANTIMVDIHVKLHPILITAYNIQEVGEANTGVSTVPEFPLPALLVVVLIAGVVVTTRFRSFFGF